MLSYQESRPCPSMTGPALRPESSMTFTRSGPATLRNVLNEGLLPRGYYALAEQHAGRAIADVLTLHATPEAHGLTWTPPDTGGIAVAEAPPRVSRKQTVEPSTLGRRRSLAIRHVSGHRLIALIEIVSPANKDLRFRPRPCRPWVRPSR